MTGMKWSGRFRYGFLMHRRAWLGCRAGRVDEFGPSVGEALETSGGADIIADALLRFGVEWPIVVSLVGLFLLSMLLSNVVNNAAAALLMAPIAASLANGFDASLDPFLMVVAVSASCAFLTPIGHQSNTLVLGPGGYRFGDYWKLGLPLSLVVMAAAIPAILWVWPL